jgi:hypothetical protein
LIDSTKIRWFAEQSDRRQELRKGGQRHSKLSSLKVGNQARVHSDQMLLVITRQEAGPHESWPKGLKRELDNNSRKPRYLVGKLE